MSAKRRNVLIFILLAAALCSAAVLSFMLATGRNSRLDRSGVYIPVSIIGEYSADGGEWKPFGGTDNADIRRVRSLRIRGHFDRAIEKNLLLMFRIQYLRVRMKINGEELFSFGGEERLHRLAASEGDVWQWIVSPGIRTTDLVELELRDVYGNRLLPVMERFLHCMFAGHADGLYGRIFEESGPASLAAVFIVVLGALELFTGTLLLFLRQRGVMRVFFCGAFSVTLGVWFVIQNAVVFLTPFPPLTAYLEMLSMYMTAVFFAIYAATYLTGPRRSIAALCAAAPLAVFTLLSVRQILGGPEVYSTLNAGIAISLSALLVCMACLTAESAASGDTTLRWISLSSLPIALGAAADAVIYCFYPGNHAQWLQRSFYLYVFAQWGIMVWQYKHNMEAAARAERLENELTRSRVAVMLAQIQPHFIYNALATIKALCAENPEAAEDAIAHFAKYLRGNMDSLSKEDLIPFRKELEHLENYIYIVRLRFGDRISFVWDIKAEGFRLPALSVQPLVENAVRYGSAVGSGGSVVRISASSDRSGATVTVEDDGSGIDFENRGSDERTHIGIENTRNRLAQMCGGTLTIENLSGKGVKAVIFIPKAADE